MYRTLSIYGFRGFSTERTIAFAIPNESNKHLGLTIIVGGNNSGKSTIFEAMTLLSKGARLTVQPKRRNARAECVEIKAVFSDGTDTCLSNRHKNDAVLEFYPYNCRKYCAYARDNCKNPVASAFCRIFFKRSWDQRYPK